MFFYSACAVTVHSCYHTVHNAVTTYNLFYTVVNARFMTLLLMSFCTGRLAVVNAICYFTVHTLHCDLCISVIAHWSIALSLYSFVITRCMVLLFIFFVIARCRKLFFLIFYDIALCMARLFM